MSERDDEPGYAGLAKTVTHGCPPSGVGTMPCCGRTPFEVPRHDRITLDPAQVTCDGPRAGYAPRRP